VAAEPTDSIFYVYKDYLGSLLTFVLDGDETDATTKYEQSFDAWGRYRSAEDWGYDDIQGRPRWMYRGYTGHEHLYGVDNLGTGRLFLNGIQAHDAFNLINMNGRLYDPVNGRMLSVDNYVQEGLGSQGYNRYTYAGNNPLKYTDPSGEFVFFILPQIGWSKNGGLHIGLEIGIGTPGALSASVTVGYSFKSKVWDASIQGSALGFYAGYGTGGAFAGYGYRYGGFSGGLTWSEGNGFGVGLSIGATGNNGVGGSFGVSWSQNGGYDASIGVSYAYKGDTNKPRTQAITQPKNDNGGTRRNKEIALGKSKYDLLAFNINESVGLGSENSYQSICNLEFENCREIAYNDAAKDFFDSVWDNTLKGAAVGAGVGWVGGPILEGVTITSGAAVGGGTAFFLRGYFSYKGYSLALEKCKIEQIKCFEDRKKN
jgi:RHS repeat-associated protein